jgi:LCP family protein required for cell wall assembly
MRIGPATARSRVGSSGGGKNASGTSAGLRGGVLRGSRGGIRLTRRARIIGRTMVGAASALVLVAAALGWYLHTAVLGSLATSHALSGLSGSSGGGVNILLMGLDSRRDMDGGPLSPAVLAQLHAGSSSDVGGYNTNTLILLHVPADGSRAVALSIPRDDYVTLPDGLGQNKIKEAYGLAKAQAETTASNKGTTDPSALEQLGREAGRRAAVEAVEQLLGVNVDHFAEINLVGFYDLANAIGGVQVCLNAPVDDSYSGAHFPAGVQTLDGAQALAFVRQRHGLVNGDLDRTHRQQAFLASAAHKLETEGVFDSLGKLSALIGVAQKDVVVDSGFDVLSFLTRAQAVTSGNVTFYTLPIKGYATIGGESVNLIDPEQIRQITQRLLAGESPDGGPTPSGSMSVQDTGADGAGADNADTANGADDSSDGQAPAQTNQTAGVADSGPAIPQVQSAQQPVQPNTGSGGAAGSGANQTAFTPPPGVPCVD